MPENSTNPMTVKLVLHGLMISKYNREQGRYELGLLSGAPDHNFSISLGEPPNEVFIPIKDFLKPNTLIWELRTSDAEGKPSIPSISLYNYDSEDNFNRRSASVADDRDFRFILNLNADEMYGDEKLAMHADTLFPVIYIYNGTVYTEPPLTPFLEMKKGDDSYLPFGYMAEKMALEVTIKEGESLSLKVQGTEQEILTFEYVEGQEVTAYIKNLPPAHASGAMMNMAQPADSDMPTHFQNYYLLVQKPRMERFEFRNSKPREHNGVMRDRKARGGPAPGHHHEPPANGGNEPENPAPGNPAPGNPAQPPFPMPMSPQPSRCGKAFLGEGALLEEGENLLNRFERQNLQEDYTKKK